MAAPQFRTCPACGGSGASSSLVERWRARVGDRIGRYTIFGVNLIPQPCPQCYGAGFLVRGGAR